MTALARRLASLEMRSAPQDAYHVIWRDDDETNEQAWARQHPGQPFPPGPLVVVGWCPGAPAEMDADEWSKQAQARR